MDILFPSPNTILAALLAIFILSYVLKKSKGGKGQKPPEASGGWPLIGHLRLLGGSQLPHITLGALADKYGPIYSIRLGTHQAVVISSWEVAKECYTVHDIALATRPKFMAAKHLGYNYATFGFSPYGHYWRELRKISATELLSNRRLELLKHVRVSEMQSSLKELYQTWSQRVTKSEYIPVELKQWIGNINLNVMFRMVCGKRYFGDNGVGDKKEAKRCKEAVAEFFRLTGVFTVGDALPLLKWLDIGGHEKAMIKTAKDLDELADQWLTEHKEKRKSSAYQGDQDFMDVMLSILDGVDLAGYDVDTVNKATCTTVIFGGTDTVTVTITWAICLLLNNPRALRKVQEELDIHVGRGRLVEESDIPKLVYLQAVIKETLRLYPAGSLGGPRILTEDCTIAGYYVPAGTRVITNLWKIQTDPRIWSDPLEFKPERFLTTHKHLDVKGAHYELIPFGSGRRQCPGISLAMVMTHLVLASLLQAYELKTPNNEPVDMSASFGLSIAKVEPLDVLVNPRLNPSAYE